ncbi:MAG TPA: YaiI/YqxD family protein [Smithellaceae bacterium]|nr:YaiI/YqxD family protein [Smithellaceae bacterium]
MSDMTATERISMQIFIDADAFPNVIKDILTRASMRLNVPLVFVANRPVRVQDASHIEVIIVPAGPDVADDRIVELVGPGDLVITADIPLADRVVGKGAFALNPRGKLYTEENIKDSMAMRGLMNELRDSGVITGGPATFSKKDRQAFANVLDSLLIKQLKKENSTVA